MITEPQATRRDLLRAATVDEIKTTALRLMRESGTTAVSFSDIAREMRMTAPALYRYFSGRDELLTALLTDSYASLADTLETARAGVPAEDPLADFRAVCRAFRTWALEDRVRFALTFGLPVPGYCAPEQGPTTDAAKRAFAALRGPIERAVDLGVAEDPADLPLPPPLETELRKHVVEEHDRAGGPAPADTEPARLQAMLYTWAALHGFVTLESFDQLAFLDHATHDALFDGLVTVLARTAGLPGTR